MCSLLVREISGITPPTTTELSTLYSPYSLLFMDSFTLMGCQELHGSTATFTSWRCLTPKNIFQWSLSDGSCKTLSFVFKRKYSPPPSISHNSSNSPPAHINFNLFCHTSQPLTNQTFFQNLLQRNKKWPIDYSNVHASYFGTFWQYVGGLAWRLLWVKLSGVFYCWSIDTICLFKSNFGKS